VSVVTLGEPVGKLLLEIPKEMLKERPIPEKTYHLHIETNGISNPKECADTLVRELYEKFPRLEILYLRVDTANIDLQIRTSSFAWLALLAWLPTILAMLGVIMILVSIYSVISAIPGWAWGLLAVGVGMVLFGPKIGEAVSAGFKAEKKYKVVRK
jgi:hypothetical protein